MSYCITKTGEHETAYLKEFMVDAETDIESLPTFPNCAYGSNCFVIGTSNVYILANDNTWHKLS